MILRRRPILRNASLRLFALFYPVLSLGVGAPAFSQAPPECPSKGNVCHMSYALCIAASCDPQGECGKMETADGRWVACDQAGLYSGTCGPCYILKGESCSFNIPCPELQDGALYSTYSEALLERFGFGWTESMPANRNATSPPPPTEVSTGWDCMDAICTPTGQIVTLWLDLTQSWVDVKTATCGCKPAPNPPENPPGPYVYMQVRSCSVPLSSAGWSTAPKLPGPSCLQ